MNFSKVCLKDFFLLFFRDFLKNPPGILRRISLLIFLRFGNSFRNCFKTLFKNFWNDSINDSVNDSYTKINRISVGILQDFLQKKLSEIVLNTRPRTPFGICQRPVKENFFTYFPEDFFSRTPPLKFSKSF